MNFSEAIAEVARNNKIVQRRSHQFSTDYNGRGGPWSEWIRIRMEDDHFPTDALLYFETNNRDDIEQRWILEWQEDQISKADILADDWLVEEDKDEC